MRIVLDTNVLIAALIARGVCNELFEYCFLHHEVVLSKPILDELQEVLVRKFNYSPSEASKASRLIKTRATLVRPSILPVPICRDLDDDIILGTALAGRCAVLVTGDKDLLELGQWKEARILKPSDFWEFEIQFEG